MNTSSQTSTAQASRRLRPLYVSQFLQGVVLWYPVEKLFMQQIGFDDASVGLLAAAYAAATLLFETPSGILADRWSRKGVLVLASMALLLNALVAGLSQGVAMYIGSALILAVYFALNSGTVDSVVYDVAMEETGLSDGFEDRLGRIRILTSFASVGGALAGGVLSQIFEPRLTYFVTVPFMALSVVTLLVFREPMLHRDIAATSLRRHVVTTFRTVLQRGALLPVIAVLMTTSVLTQVVIEFGPLWLVGLGAPVLLYGPHGAALLSSFGLGGAFGGRVQPLGSVATTVGFVVLLMGSAMALVVLRDPILVTVAQVVLTSSLVAVSLSFTRLLHDSIPSSVRAGVSSAVGSLTWLSFLPFAVLFGAVSRGAGVFSAGWMVLAATGALGGLLLGMTLQRRRLVSTARLVAAS